MKTIVRTVDKATGKPFDFSKFRFIQHPDAERFDKVTIEMVERWKESELSGDEWRFSHRLTFWSHGVPFHQSGNGSIEKTLTYAAYQFDRVHSEHGDLEKIIQQEYCCQPSCEEFWTILKHPIKKYDSTGDRMATDYRPNEVRGFCPRHSMRGDCGLDDSDANYVDLFGRVFADDDLEMAAVEPRISASDGV